LPENLRGRIGRGLPVLTDPDQAYFWSADWQRAERATEADLSAGRFRDFQSVHDAVRWLLSEY